MVSRPASRDHRFSTLQTPGDSPRQVRPPSGGKRMPPPGVLGDRAIRQTARVREIVRPVPSGHEVAGYTMTHAYVRRFWVAAIGPGAVADLLRLAAAAQSGRSLRRPTHLPSLLREGLVSHTGGNLYVPDSVPRVPSRLVRSMPPALRRAHRQHAAHSR
jgi:hypothetical protein